MSSNVSISPIQKPIAAEAGEIVNRLEDQVGTIIRGKQEVIRLAIVCLIARGHLLIEDVPGVGKTTLARALARSMGLDFQRIQFTSDLMPSDILGVSVYRQGLERFEFVPGPIFSNVVLADEINRASPKTQSALLEAMGEGNVSVDRGSFELPQPFIVLATQNPLEYVGTFPLPESQLDRFTMSIELGYPPQEEELWLLQSGGIEDQLAGTEAAVSLDEIVELQEQATQVTVADKLAKYLLALAEATRESDDFVLGVSTRGVQSVYRAAQAMALCEGRRFAIPDDVQRVAVPVLAHRVALKGASGDMAAAGDAIARLIATIPVPL